MSEECISFLYQKNITSLNQIPQSRQLIFKDSQKQIEFLLIRSKDVATYVEQGAADMGIVGYDILQESLYEVFIPLALPFGKCRLSVAFPEGKSNWKKRKTIRVATKYPKLSSEYFHLKGYNISIIELYGSIEIAPITGISDVIVDLISTGKTLKANHLEEGQTILKSHASLIMNKGAYIFKRDKMNKIISQFS